jgi:hypothetical protein
MPGKKRKPLAQANSWSAWLGPVIRKYFPIVNCLTTHHVQREGDPVSLYVQPAVVYRYCKRSSFPHSPGSHLFSRMEQYNDLSLIQANTFFKTVLKYFTQLLSCGALEHNATHQFFRHTFPRFVRRVTVFLQS